MAKGVCKNCKKEKDINLSGKSEGLCHVCYKKLLWNPKIIECKRCKRQLPMHAHGLCRGCYASVFHVQSVLKNKRKEYKISEEQYHKITEKCIFCGFDKIVDLHHLDRDYDNISPDNLVGLCPNHHKMIHHRDFQQELYEILSEKGFKIPKIYPKDEVFKQDVSV